MFKSLLEFTLLKLVTIALLSTSVIFSLENPKKLKTQNSKLKTGCVLSNLLNNSQTTKMTLTDFLIGNQAMFPCEEVCEINRSTCQNEVNSGQNACLQIVQTNLEGCMTQAELDYNNCMSDPSKTPSFCNQELNQSQISCHNQRFYDQLYCNQQAEVGTEYCTNDYENCLFACQQ